MSAGARLTVMRRSGKVYPALARAAPIRSRPSRTAPCGSMAAQETAGALRYSDHPSAGRTPETRGSDHRWSYDMGRITTGLVLLLSIAGCAVPKVAGAPLAPVARAWEVPTLELYTEWWRRTEACSGRKGDMSRVRFYAVDAPEGAIGLNGTLAHGWWVRQWNRVC